jgi:hypothetical protein
VFHWYSRIFHDSKPDGISIGIGAIAGAVLLENGFWSEHIAPKSGENQLTEFIVSNELTSMFDLARRLEILKMEEILICCSRVLLPVPWFSRSYLGGATIQFSHVRSSLYAASQWQKSRFLRSECAVDARQTVEIPTIYLCLREINRSRRIISPR